MEDKPKSQPSARACDRCRRRKAKCDFTDTTCSRCHLSGVKCTFDIPLGRRGPKTRQSRQAAAEGAAPSVEGLSESNHLVRSTGDFPVTNPTWEPRLSLETTLSPQQQLSAESNPGPERASSRLLSVFQQWGSLAAVISRKIPQFSLETIIIKCIDLYLEYLFPLIPLIHEPNIRYALTFFASQNASVGNDLRRTNVSNTTLISPSTQRNSIGSGFEEIGVTLDSQDFGPESTFTLLTALCAEAASLLPKEIFPEGDLIANVFLEASRNCLNTYLEADLENPTASSIAIRYFHSNCLHAAGKPKFSWHIFGEATRLAQVMQLQDEASYEGVAPIEAELRRRAFWIVSVGDKSASVLNNRPITLHKFSFESGITAAYPAGNIPRSPETTTTVKGQADFITGFNANLRLWHAASDFLLEMRRLREQDPSRITGQPLSVEARNFLDVLYVRFMTCLDDLPRGLQVDNYALTEDDVELPKQIIIQRVNLQVSYHCLRMVITQKLETPEFIAPGSVEQMNMVLLRKTEIARDMLQVIREAPFWALQINGEPCVEKIRLVGASLLAIIHGNETSPLSTRARNDLAILLDTLTRLDSKASDTLRNGSPWVV